VENKGAKHGTQILRDIRDQRRPIRCAVVNGSFDAELVREAQPCGAELILRKPLDHHALLAWLDHGLTPAHLP
jgi:DNA-binding NarL/FixJ family response regulator